MIFRKPKFWDNKNPNLIAYFLLPFTIFLEINNFLLRFKKKKINIKVKSICVGNIYVGGTGKTPTAIKIYNILKKIGFLPVIGKKYYNDQIDEINILKSQVEVITDKLRLNILSKAIQKRNDVVIFDDGLQDKSISYDLQITCFDSDSLCGNNLLIPAGPLRERISKLSNYDCVILKDQNKNTVKFIKSIKKINNKIKIFFTYLKIINLNKFKKSKKYIIFSGIGNPESFKKTLLKNKINIIKEITFPDHYTYKKYDINKIKKIAFHNNAQIITTEKDFVKLSKSQKKNINFLKVETKFVNEKKFINYIKSKMYEKN